MSYQKVFGKGAEKIVGKKIVIIGAGGTGCSVAQLLGRMRVPFTIIDSDIVDTTNLERQMLFDMKDLLKPKVVAIKEHLKDFCEVIAIAQMIDEKNVEMIGNPDLVIDCTDNLAARLVINKYCLDKKISWIYTGAVHGIGALYVIDARHHDAPCFACFNQDKEGETSCEIGVLNAMVSIVGSLAVNMALQYLIEGKIEKEMLRINLSTGTITRVKVNKKKNCICSKL